MSPDLVEFVLTPLLIFLARILDVSIGTLRIMLVARGVRLVSSLLGFFEVLIWLVAISQIIRNLTEWQNYIAYAAGFAAGTWVGMTLERKLVRGNLLVRVIVPVASADLVMYLISRNYRVTYLDAEGALGPVKIVLTIVPRESVDDVIAIIKRFDPNLFYTVEDVRMVSEQPSQRLGRNGGWFGLRSLTKRK